METVIVREYIMLNWLRSTKCLLFVTTLTLILGLIVKYLFELNQFASWLWIAGGLAGLIPAIFWFLDELKDKQIGSDVLAIFSIAAALITREFFAAAVIGLMLATGRVLETWARSEEHTSELQSH